MSIGVGKELQTSCPPSDFCLYGFSVGTTAKQISGRLFRKIIGSLGISVRDTWIWGAAPKGPHPKSGPIPRQSLEKQIIEVISIKEYTECG
jgi:hypothetical protein